MPSADADERIRRGWLLDLAPLRDNPAYSRMWFSGVSAGIGANITVVAVGIHIYELTRSTAAVALVGVFALGPMILVGIFGGPIVDAFDRRTVVLWATLVAWLSAVGIAGFAWLGTEQLAVLYLLTTISATSSTLVGTARFAIHPRLVPREQLPAAAALSGISAGLQATIGPALAGVLVVGVGFAWTYTIDVVLFATGFFGLLTLPPIRPEGEQSRPGFGAVVYGLRFLLRAPTIRTVFLIHLAAMAFGRPQVLFPAVGAVLLGGGPLTVGILSAAGAAGVLLSSFLSGKLGAVRKHGTAIVVSTGYFAVSIAVFGGVIAVLDPTGALVSGPDRSSVNGVALAAAVIALFASGAADNIAGIFRTTMLQSAVPDYVRGRMQGLFTVVLTAGPRLGDVYVGSIVGLGALWLAPVFGGATILVLLAVLVLTNRGLRRYDALEPTP